MTKVRTTFKPDVILDVEPPEFLDLSRQGLLHSHEAVEGGPKSVESWKGGESTTGLDVQPSEGDTKTKKGDN